MLAVKNYLQDMFCKKLNGIVAELFLLPIKKKNLANTKFF